MSGDSLFNYVTCLVDESTAAAGSTYVTDLLGGRMNLSGSAAVTTAVTLFGRPTISLNLSGSADSVSITSNPFSFSGDTEGAAEFWIYPTSFADAGALISGESSGWGYNLWVSTAGQVGLHSDSAWSIPYAGPALSLNAWNHVALVLTSSTTMTVYVNGTPIGSTTVSAAAKIGTGAFSIGTNGAWGGVFRGYLGPVRVTKGAARYTAAFTPPTEAFPTAMASTTDTSSSSSSSSTTTTTTATDPHFSYVTTLVDESLAAAGDTSVKDLITGQSLVGTNGPVVASDVTLFGRPTIKYNGAGYGWLSADALDLSTTSESTLEFWIYPTAYRAVSLFATGSNNGSMNGYFLGFNAAGLLCFYVREYYAIGYVGDPLPLNAWTHVALVITNSTTVTMFVGGKLVGTGAVNSQAQALGQSGAAYVGNTVYGDGTFVGNLGPLRITKGVARYRADFTPPTSAFPTISGSTTYATDDYLDSVVLLLESGTDGTFSDKSSHAAGITYAGAGLATSPTKFGSVSLWPNASYLPALADYNLGSSDFTIEGWVYLNATPAPYATLVGNLYDPSIGWRVIISPEMNVVLNAYWTGQEGVVETVGAKMVMNQWVHLAVVRHGNTITSYVNGVVNVTRVATSMGSINDSGNQLEMGATMGGYWPFSGYLDSLRITKGVARYLDEFTPPTAAFPTTLTAVVEDATTGTDPYFSSVKVLMTMDGAAAGSTIVHDTLGNTITCENGTAVTTAKTHFGRPTIALTGAGNGRLVLTPASALNLSGASASTVEGWIYPTAIPSGVVGGSHCTIFSSGTSTGGMGGFFVTASSTGQLGLYMREYWCIAPGSAGAIKMKAWNHIAVCFVGATAYLFANGVLQGTGTISTTYPALAGSDFAAVVGTIYSDATPSGYMGQFRVTAGVARYLSGFTPPTQAFPTAATTSASGSASDGSFSDVALLLHCNDASYPDSSIHGFSPLAISGVSVSAAHVMLGDGALYFDGTGTGLSYAHADALNLATIDFTVELGVYLPALGNYCLFQKDQHYGSTFTSYSAQVLADGSILMSVGTGSSGASAQNIQTPAGTLTAATYHRLAFVRSGKQVYIFVDGALITVDTQVAATADGASPLVFGYFPAGGANNDWRLVGYLDEIRITRSARYTAAYTVDTLEFASRKPYFAGTVLDESGAPAARTILALRRDTCTVVATTTSSATNGTYKLETPYGGEHDLIAQDSTGNLADLIITRVTPV